MQSSCNKVDGVPMPGQHVSVEMELSPVVSNKSQSCPEGRDAVTSEDSGPAASPVAYVMTQTPKFLFLLPDLALPGMFGRGIYCACSHRKNEAQFSTASLKRFSPVLCAALESSLAVPMLGMTYFYESSGRHHRFS